MTSIIRFAGTKNDLKKIFSIVSSISEETAFEFERDRIIIKCHDESRVTYLDMEIKKGYFQDFEVGKFGEIGFRVSEILKVVEMCSDKISLSIDRDISLISKSEIGMEAHILLIDIESEEIRIPEREYSTSALLKVEYLKNCLSQIFGFSKFVEIGVNEGIRLEVNTPSGNHITFDVPVEPSSNLSRKDSSIAVDISVMKDIIQYLDEKRNIQLRMDNSLTTIELIYEEDDLYIRSLFCVIAPTST